MTTFEEYRFDQLRGEATELGLAVVDAGTEVAEWRREVGPKSKWSAHTKLTEHSKFKAFEDATKSLEAFLHRHIPEHWGLQGWGFRVSRMGEDIRWASKNGKGMGGQTTTIDRQRMIAQIGTWVGLIVFSRRKTGIRRLAQLGLSVDELTRFSFRIHRCHVEANGFGAADAYANVAFQGLLGNFAGPAYSASIQDCYNEGLGTADNITRFPAPWSAGPTLWSQLRKDKRIRKLKGPAPKYIPHSPPWRKYGESPSRGGDQKNTGFEQYDLVLATALALLKPLPNHKGVRQSFLLQEGGSYGIEAKGWCGASAVLHRIVSELDIGNLPKDLKDWQVFALADERGGSARIVAKELAVPVVE